MSFERVDRDGCTVIVSGLCGNTVRKYKKIVAAGRISNVSVTNWKLGLDVFAMEDD